MPRLRLSPLPPAIALRLSPSSVRALVAGFGGESLSPFDPDDNFAVAEALSFRPVPITFADVLALLTRLATPVGREALLEILTRTEPGAKSARDLRGLSPENLAVRVLCSRGMRPSVARAAIQRALIRVARHFSPNPWYTLLWPHAALPDRPEAILDAAREVHGRDFEHAWIAGVDEHGVLRVIVVHRGLGECIPTSIAGVRQARTRRPLACDVIRWDPRDGRVSFSLARPALLSDWAAAIGRACAGDAHAFSDRPAFTHKPLHEKGEAWLASLPLPRGVTKIDVVACEVYDGKTVRLRGEHALARMHEQTGGPRGYLRSLTLRMLLAGHDEPVDATIELPWKVHLSDGRFEEELRGVMEVAQMHAPGSLPDDLTSLGAMQPEWRCSDLLGAANLARAIERKILKRVRGKHPSGREHRRWGSLLRAFEVPGEDGAYVVGEDLAIRAFEAGPETLVWYAPDWARVAEVIRAEAGLTDVNVPDAPDGFVPLGAFDWPSRRVIVFSVIRAVADAEVLAILKHLRLACGRAMPALLMPLGRTFGGAIPEIAVKPEEQLGLENIAGLAGRIATECGLADDLEPGVFATEAAPLVLSVARGEAWYFKVRLLVTENQLAMFFALARAADGMKSIELGTKIAPTADHPDQIVRKARLTLEERLVASFEEAGVSMPAGLAERIVLYDRSKGYRLGIGVIVR